MNIKITLEDATPVEMALILNEALKLNPNMLVGITTEAANLHMKNVPPAETAEAAPVEDAKVKKLDSKKEKAPKKPAKAPAKASEDTESEDEDEEDGEEEEDPKPSKKSSKTSKEASKSGGTKKAGKSKPAVEEDSDDDDEEEDEDEEEEGDDEVEIVEVPEKYTQESLRKLAAGLSQKKLSKITDAALEYFEAETIPDLDKSDYEKFYKYVIKRYKKATEK